MSKITGLTTHDVRFPTSRTFAGSDAMNSDPDYSAAYVVLHTDDASGEEGHALTFTIGRGTEVCIAAVEALSGHVVGASVEELVENTKELSSQLARDSQLRWLGPEKGVVHMAAGALVNAVWDLKAKLAGKPVWKLLSDMTPEQIVDCVDFTYIADVLDTQEALSLLESVEEGKDARERSLLADGFPAYTTSAGWYGYSDESLPDRAREALAAGFTHLKLKVGGDLETDIRRARLIRGTIGSEHQLSIDANQAWMVDEAIDAVRAFAEIDPYWVEEPTSPDDILGHQRIRQEGGYPIATGEHVQNRIIFKQLLQSSAVDFCQIDCCRLAGVNEVIAVLLLAAKFGVPVCPHAGGVGLCEYAQHISMFDFVAVSGSRKDRVCEFVDHLHEHFVAPVEVVNGSYRAPKKPGYSIEMHATSLAEYAYPDGPVWRELTRAT